MNQLTEEKAKSKYLSEHPETDRRVVLANEISMERFLKLLTAQYGGIAHYFEQIGLSAADLERIRKRLVRTNV